MDDDYSWIVRGKQRKQILKNMNGPKIPTQIKEATKLGLNNVSDVLRAMSKRKIVECKNPLSKTGRIYILTKKGLKLKQEFEKYSN